MKDSTKAFVFVYSIDNNQWALATVTCASDRASNEKHGSTQYRSFMLWLIPIIHKLRKLQATISFIVLSTVDSVSYLYIGLNNHTRFSGEYTDVHTECLYPKIGLRKLRLLVRLLNFSSFDSSIQKYHSRVLTVSLPRVHNKNTKYSL